jgi:hypothetical protein
MSYNVQVVKSSDFVRLDARGKVDLAESRRVLSEVAQECVDRGINHALLDVRDLYSDLVLTDLYALARTFADVGFRRTDRLAVLHRYNSGEKAEFFAMCANDRGWDVRAFEDFEEAIEWFGSPRPVECQ